MASGALWIRGVESSHAAFLSRRKMGVLASFQKSFWRFCRGRDSSSKSALEIALETALETVLETALENALATLAGGARKRIENRIGFCIGFWFWGVAARPLGASGGLQASWL